MSVKRIPIPKPQGHCCFACGTANPIGLNLQFYLEEGMVCADITLGRHYEGWENIAHGGILSTILDEVMSWTIIVLKRVFFVTRKMEVRYVKPVPIGTPLRVRGRLLDDSRPPRIRAGAEIADGEGTVMARASGEFVVLPEERLSMVPNGLKKDMKELFEEIKAIY
ncbi:MAG: PaaI family thioesterase [Deltaproteobacteria bacterium]|nr:PaaI family thioesterase [Deltaproteobacteria bacterium]